MTESLIDHALGYARRALEVFPLTGKVPAIKGGRGCLDATADEHGVARLWATRPSANIGVHLPASLLVIDIDPRHGGHIGLQALEDAHGTLPATRTSLSGRGDGGCHLWFRHPGGKISARRLPRGIDLKSRGGYVVVPPSIHPDTGAPYTWADRREPVDLPAWFVELLRPAPAPAATAKPTSAHGGASVADAFTGSTTWGDVLEPYRWECARGNGDEDGSVWRHPEATSACSATVRHGCLFVYSSSTEFVTTEAGTATGYTRFRAWATLAHQGNLSAAAHDLIDTVRGRGSGPARTLPVAVLDAVHASLERHAQDQLAAILGAGS